MRQALRVVAVIVLGMAMATSAVAGPVTVKELIAGGVTLPPPEFDYVPKKKLFVSIVPHSRVQKTCANEWRDGARVRIRGIEAFGCRFASRIIYLSDRLDAEARAFVLRHEYGHVNGWDHD